jgi:uncharacterized phiE125 gp8 family phage protein
MKVKLVTPPVLECVSLAEVKRHLRLDSETLDGNLTLTQSMSFGSHAIADDYTTHVGTGVSVLGKEAEVLVHAGTNGATGTVDTKIQESDDDVAYTDWAGGAFDQITAANDNADYKKQYTGAKAYIRTVSKVLLAACEFGTSILVNASTTPEDDLLTDLIEAARGYVEDITRRALLTQVWEYYLDAWPCGDNIVLPFGKLQDVAETQFIKWKDSDGDETTLTEETDYLWETNDDQCGRVVLPYSVSWPSGTLYPSKPITIRFVAGWTAAASIPSKIKAAILLTIADLYENREAKTFAISGGYYVNNAVSQLLASVKLWNEF